MTEAIATTAPTYRHSMLVLALWALGVGVPLAVAGWLFWEPLCYMGGGIIAAGVIWLLLLPFTSSEPISPAAHRFFRVILPAMGSYFLAMFVFGVVAHLPLASWANALIALLPVLPVVWLVFMMWRLIRDSDELHRRIAMESLLITSGVVAVLTFAAGMLEAVGILQLSEGLLYVFPLMCTTYGIAGWRCQRKYGFKGIC
ncbi:MAG TPA: hypothetical protein VFJ15_14005 [Oleiagrimonas sp.]|nr:hypothetical protein [Oleiagrimonas sp.]